MKSLYVKDLKEKLGEEVEFQGFVDTIRDKKWVQFVVIRDNTGKVQMTIEKSLEENQKMVELISNLSLESTVKIKGKVVGNDAVKLNGFEDRKIRTIWDEESEEWYFSIVDVVGILTDSPNPRKYWSVLKNRLKKSHPELTTNCSQLKMTAVAIR